MFAVVALGHLWALLCHFLHLLDALGALLAALGPPWAALGALPKPPFFRLRLEVQLQTLTLKSVTVPRLPGLNVDRFLTENEPR